MSSEKQEVHTKANISQHRNPTNDIASVQRIVEARHRVTTGVRNLLHLRQFIGTASGKVKEGEFIKVFSLLIGLFDNLDTDPQQFVDVKWAIKTDLVVALL